MNTSPQQLERLEKGQRRLTLDWLKRAATALGCEPADLIATGEEPRLNAMQENAVSYRYEGSAYDTNRRDLPIYGTALGAPRLFDDEAIEQTMLNSGDTIGYVRRPSILNGRADVYGLYIVNNSMAPVHPEGATVIAESKRPPRSGDDVVVYLRPSDESDDGQRARAVLVKRLVRKTAHYVELEQFTPAITFRLSIEEVLRIDRIMQLGDILD